MRKAEMLRQNVALFEQLQKANAENALLQQKLTALEERVAQLKEELESSKTQPVTESLKRLERRMTDYSGASLSPDMEYGAAVIGKVVLLAAEYSNRLTAGGETGNRELVNLILGRTEVAKAEILNIVSSDAASEDKRVRIDQQQQAATEYIESVMAQQS